MRALADNVFFGCLLYVPWEFDMLGGVDVVVDKLYRHISNCPETRDKVWIGVQDWETAGESSDEAGRRFLRLNLPAPPTNPGLAWLRYAVSLGRRLRHLSMLFMEMDIRIINCHFPLPNTYAVAIMKKLGLWNGRLVLSFHGSDVLGINPQTHVWRTIAAETSCVTACSHALATQVATLGLWPREKIAVIHNGIDEAAFMPNEPSPLATSGRNYILNVGNYVPRKAQHILLQAFARMANHHEDIDLVFVGGKQNGEWLKALSQQAETLAIGTRTLFLTDVPHRQIPALMRNALLFVLTSENESFGLVIIEAGISGLAVIATDTGGIPEIITSPQLGRLFPVGDVDTLVRHLEALLNDDPLRRTLAENLRNHVGTHFSENAMGARYLKSFR